MSFVSELQVGSLLLYPKGKSTASASARAFIRYDIKQGKVGRIEHAVKRLTDVLPGSPLEELLGAAGVLVPAPGHTPRLQGGLWVPERICQVLVAAGVGERVLPIVERWEAVAQSSSKSSAENRVDPKEHHRTLRVLGLLEGAARFTLVDDVVTRGSTLIGCATRLREHFPKAEIRAFALARVAQEDLQATTEMLAPALEVIRYSEATGVLERR